MSEGKIEKIELFHVDIPLPTPFFPAWIPGYPQDRQRYTLLRITTRDGLVGHATGTAFNRERDGLGEFIGPFLVGLDPYDVDAAVERLRQSSFLGWRNAWMELAFWDLAAQVRGVPLWRLIAERIQRPAAAPTPIAVPGPLPAYASFGETRAAAVRAEVVERARRAGFRAAKLSVHAFDEAEDRAQLEMARSAAGDDFALAVHAHQGSTVSVAAEAPRWDLDRALRFAERARALNVAWLQEPLSSDDPVELAALRQRAPLPIAGGDLASSRGVLRSLIRGGAYGLLTPDITFAGLSAVIGALQLCAEAGMAFSPRTYGDGLGLLASAHALAAWSVQEGIREPVMLEYPWEPPAIIPEHRDALLDEPIGLSEAGTVVVPGAPGLGVAIDAKALRRFAHRFYTLTPVRFVASTARKAGMQQTAAFARPKRARFGRRSKALA